VQIHPQFSNYQYNPQNGGPGGLAGGAGGPGSGLPQRPNNFAWFAGTEDDGIRLFLAVVRLHKHGAIIKNGIKQMSSAGKTPCRIARENCINMNANVHPPRAVGGKSINLCANVARKCRAQVVGNCAKFFCSLSLTASFYYVFHHSIFPTLGDVRRHFGFSL